LTRPSQSQQQKTIAPVDKEIVSAFDSPKLFDCSDADVIKICGGSVSIAFADLSRKADESLNEEVEYILSRLPGSLKRLFPSMRLKEVALAIERGTCKEYGEYYGLNVAEFVRFCRSYMDSEKRVNTAKELLKPVSTPTVKPGAETEFNLYKTNLLGAMDKLKNGHNFEVNAPSLYDFCDKLKLINFTTNEKYEFLAEAAQCVIRDQQLKLSVIVEDYHRKPLKRIIDVITECVEKETPLPGDIAVMVKAKAKYLTLKAFLQEVEINELELAYLVEAKKELFLSL
jgi:hypothetical protein